MWKRSVPPHRGHHLPAHARITTTVTRSPLPRTRGSTAVRRRPIAPPSRARGSPHPTVSRIDPGSTNRASAFPSPRPARAGITRRQATPVLGIGALPRAPGDHPKPASPPPWSPLPRARGSPADDRRTGIDTQPFPRARGGHPSGMTPSAHARIPSPRARGSPADRQRHRSASATFPARPGITPPQAEIAITALLDPFHARGTTGPAAPEPPSARADHPRTQACRPQTTRCHRPKPLPAPTG